MQTPDRKTIVIIGGGFGGIRCALDLHHQLGKSAHIILISDKPHFEYHAALYRVVTGRSPLEVCIPLEEIFEGTSVEVVQDTVTAVSLLKKTVTGSSESVYHYDYLVLAPGSETTYFNTPGLKELAFGFKSIDEALKLKNHLHEIFSSCVRSSAEDKECSAHVVIVGGGASGTELAGELVTYMKKLAQWHQLDPAIVKVDLIHSGDRLVQMLPEKVSHTIENHLKGLGVNLMLNQRLMKEEVEHVYLKDMEMRTKTVVWTAGVAPHHMLKAIEGLTCDAKGRVIVDDRLQAQGTINVFVLGDSAATPQTGMAQTAVHDGTFVAETIVARMQRRQPAVYVPPHVIYSIPAGPGWAATVIGKKIYYGRIGWWLRRLADWRYFASILPFGKARAVFMNGQRLSESCAICSKYE